MACSTPQAVLESIECPVCRCVMVHPLMFECGHTVCELCCIKLDAEAASNAPSLSFPLFRCPTCRTATFENWHQRSRNHALQTVLSAMPEYSELSQDGMRELTDYLNENVDIVANANAVSSAEVDENINLATICRKIRRRKIQSFVSSLIPIVMDAAHEGHPYVSVNTRARELSMYASEISKSLFKLGIHSVHATVREFTIHICQPDNDEWNHTYVNAQYEEGANDSGDSEREESDTAS